ncbi:hypothetical protein [Kutzneria chonburiensis]|uniref:hypothetical protein n=1 Tax=Kutzneria chonburiensis TaxID=1483604 RepID=UPI0023605149|nr:hypothetical protein [Kutzneria chonburiensis]
MPTASVSVRPCRPISGSHPEGDQRPIDLQIPDDVSRAIWYELFDQRAAVHSRHRVRYCDTEFRLGSLRLGADGVGAPQVLGYHLVGNCPCRDLVADAFEVALAYLTDHGDEFANPAGAVRTHLKYRLIDLDRHARVERGAPARPEVVATNRYGRMLPDDFHRAVLVMLVDEAGSSGPLRGAQGLLQRLAYRCAGKFDGEPADYLHRLPEVLAVIETICRTGPRVNIGTADEPELVTWWDARIDRPLGRRADPADHVIDEDRWLCVAAPSLTRAATRLCRTPSCSTSSCARSGPNPPTDGISPCAPRSTASRRAGCSAMLADANCSRTTGNAVSCWHGFAT